MYTDEQRADEWNVGNAKSFASVKPQGEDRQLPAVGFRATSPIPTDTEEQTAKRSGPPRFLLTGLGLIVPTAALLVPPLRKQLVQRSRGDRVGQFAAGVAPEIGSPRRRRTGTAFLLAAGVASGALLYWLGRSGQRPGTIRQAIMTITERVEAFAPPVAAPLRDAAPTEATRPVQEPAQVMGQSPQPASSTDATSRVPGAVATAEQIPAARGATINAPTTRSADEATAPPAAKAVTEQSARQEPATPTLSPVKEAPARRSEVSPASTTPPAAAPAPAPQTAASQTAAPVPAKVEQEELAARIVAHMTVVDNKGARVGAVDRMEGTARIKLTKDGQGRHHHLPLGWVARVDTQVHLDRSLKEVRQTLKARQPRGR